MRTQALTATHVWLLGFCAKPRARCRLPTGTHSGDNSGCASFSCTPTCSQSLVQHSNPIARCNTLIRLNASYMQHSPHDSKSIVRSTPSYKTRSLAKQLAHMPVQPDSTTSLEGSYNSYKSISPVQGAYISEHIKAHTRVNPLCMQHPRDMPPTRHPRQYSSSPAAGYVQQLQT